MRALLGCELGHNRGHLTSMEAIAKRLLDSGWEVALAIPKRFSATDISATRLTIFEAPTWNFRPCSELISYSSTSSNMGDILEQLGIYNPDVFTTALYSWRFIIDLYHPDIIIADYAPGLLTAGRGLVPRISIGTGFTCPPSDTKYFKPISPHLGHTTRSEPPQGFIESLQSHMRALGLRPVNKIPELFEAECELLATLRELDPYADARLKAEYIVPSASFTVSNDIHLGYGAFIYSYNFVPPESLFWLAVAATDLRTTVYMQNPTAEHLRVFKRFGFNFSSTPLDFEQIARISCVVISHGGHGTICSSLISGIPSITAAIDLEKYLNGSFISRIGCGNVMLLAGTKPMDLADTIVYASKDTDMIKRTNLFGKSVRKRYPICFTESVLNAVIRLT